MRFTKAIIVVAALWAAQASAEQQFGVEVYPGAKPEAGVAKSLKENLKLNAATYRTGDSMEKVVEFYRKQKLKENPGTDNESAGFMGEGVMVTLQNPWADMKTGKLNKDTLISIVKQ